MKKTYDKSSIMKMAWEIRKAGDRYMSMSDALKLAWTTTKGGYRLTTPGLIKRYGVAESGNGMISASNADAAQQDGMEKVVAEIKARKPEILAWFQSQRDAQAARQARIDAIPGLTKLRAAYAERAEYRRRFNRSFDGDYAVGGMGVGPRPTVDMEALKRMYPVAAAYLIAEDKYNSENFRISGIGWDVMEMIIASPRKYAAAMAMGNARMREYLGARMYD